MQCTSEVEALIEEVAREGFAFAPSARLRPLLDGLADWEAFAASWNDLPRDNHPEITGGESFGAVIALCLRLFASRDVLVVTLRAGYIPSV